MDKSLWLVRIIGVLMVMPVAPFFKFTEIRVPAIAIGISPAPQNVTLTPSPTDEELQLIDVLFDQNRADIRADAAPLLQENAQILKRFRNLSILIEGYSDIRGEEQYNMKLAELRAKAVRAHLGTLGIDTSRIEVLGRGPTTKFSSGDTEEDFQLNRRVHFVIKSDKIPKEALSSSSTQSSKQNVPVPATLYEMIEEELKKLASTKILFGPPREMKLGKSEKVSAQILITLIPELQSALEQPGTTEGGEIVLGQTVSLRLSGNNFDVAPAKNHEDLVVSDGVEQWNWSATPLKSGLNSLLLTATLKINIDGGVEEKKEYPLYLKAINVGYDPFYSTFRLIKGHWYWFAGTLIILGLILWTAKRHR